MKKNLYAAETGAGFSGWSGDSDSKGCEDPAEAESAEKAEVEKAVITHPVVVGVLRESCVKVGMRILCLQIPAVMEPLRQ